MKKAHWNSFQFISSSLSHFYAFLYPFCTFLSYPPFQSFEHKTTVNNISLSVFGTALIFLMTAALIKYNIFLSSTIVENFQATVDATIQRSKGTSNWVLYNTEFKVFYWKDWGKLQNISVGIAGIWTENKIQTFQMLSKSSNHSAIELSNSGQSPVMSFHSDDKPAGS